MHSNSSFGRMRGGMGRGGWGNTNKYEKTFVGDTHVHYIDCGDNFTSV